MSALAAVCSWRGVLASTLAFVACVAVHARQAQMSAQTSVPTAASAPTSGVTAIVGARIIDGSGNSPFEGTVVVRGDRIAEVGRTVAPPAGARIVDAKGRTILPALVDLGVALPRGSDEEMTRALAAYLYAGVTSIVPANLSPSEIDALRDRVGRSGTLAPRLAIAADASRLVRGTASGGALADARALTDWKQRNVTYVPELALAAPADRRAPTPLLQEMRPADAQGGNGNGSGNGGGGGVGGNASGGSGDAQASPGASSGGASSGGASSGMSPSASTVPSRVPGSATTASAAGAADPARWKALLDQTKAARDAGVRLGVGSGAGASASIEAGGATGASAPATTAAGAGATATSPAAGAGAGTTAGTAPSAVPHGWGTLLAARLLVDAGLTPLQAVTAATSGGTWALSLQSDRGFLAVGQRADLLIVTGDPSSNIGDLERVERVFLGGSELDRATLRTLITRPATPAPTTPDPTAAASAAARAKTPAPDPRTPAGRRALREARARAKAGNAPLGAAGDASATATPTPGNPAGTVAPGTTAAGTAGAPGSTATPGGATTTTTTGDPATASPASGSPASAAASGDPASATTAAAAAAGGAAIAASGALLDDFEGGDDSSALGRIWTSAAESATSTTTVVAGRVVRGARDHALHLTARMGDARDAHARVSLKVSQDGRPLDASRFHGLRFDARGQGRYRVIFISRSVSDGRYHEAYFSGSPNWTPVGIPFASVGQTGTTRRVPWTGRDLLEIVFQISRDPGDLGWLELDNIRFY